jgi:Nitrile hydratase, alpha chain
VSVGVRVIAAAVCANGEPEETSEAARRTPVSHNESDDPTDAPAPAPKSASGTEPSRRHLLQLLSAMGVVAVVPGTAAAADWPAIPHADIVQRALTEPTYRANLISKPKQTLANEHGVVLGASTTVVVVIDTLAQVHVVVSTQAGMRGPETGMVAEILHEYRTDAVFRNQLVNTPRDAFEDWTGATIPAELMVEVVQESPSHRVIHLPAEETLGVESAAEIEAMWGGDDGWGGGGDWTAGTYESGQACNCFTDQLDSIVATCCFDDPETQSPGG